MQTSNPSDQSSNLTEQIEALYTAQGQSHGLCLLLARRLFEIDADQASAIADSLSFDALDRPEMLREMLSLQFDEVRATLKGDHDPG